MGKSIIDFKDEYFEDLIDYVRDDNITDINASQGVVWVKDVNGRVTKLDKTLSDSFIKKFSIKIADSVGEEFNGYSPLLEAETDTLRISVVHDSVASTGYALSIRKTLKRVRLSEEIVLETKYCNKEVLELLKLFIKNRYNIVFCGNTGSGKTELLKFLTGYIPLHEKVITIEDNYEIHYEDINPGSHCVSWKVDDELFTYTNAIKASLRQDPDRILLSEARSLEVKYLLECLSTGICGMTTLHTDDVRKVPDRVFNMLGSDTDRAVVNDVHSFLDVGILLKKIRSDDGSFYRRIEQICVYRRVNGKNEIVMLVDDGRVINDIPEYILAGGSTNG